MMATHNTARSGQNNASRKRSRNSEPPTANFSGQKRDKYTATACNECRRRKIKCSGDVPCRRCENYDLRCEYCQGSGESGHQNTPNSRITSLEQNVASLQAQVSWLSGSLKMMQDTSQHSQKSSETVHSQAQTHLQDLTNTGSPSVTPTQPRFIGPTSSAYNFSVANNTLQMMGIQRDETEDLSRVASAIPSRCSSPQQTVRVAPSGSDPLFALGMEETYRTLELYRDEIHPVYPFVPIEEIVRLVPSVYQHLGHEHMSSAVGTINDQCCATKTQDVQILKLLVACALVVEGRGQSRVGQLLVNSADGMQRTSARELGADIQGLRVFTLTSIYYFHADELVLAWRTIGFAARIALEIGLHRRESLEQVFVEFQEREWALKLFWCIYVLDRRWSFGIGLPFALQDSDIDPCLPHLHDSEPYLECLIDYGKICSKVWTAVAGYSNKLADKDTVAYLDFQIQQWQKSIPAQFQLLHPRLGEGASNQPRNLQRLRVLLYCRANQMRGYIHRHNVLSASNISENLDGARCVTEIAKDTIGVLQHLRNTSTIYDTQQSAFNYFLVSALSALFLAVCHAPAEFSQSCRNEFYSALGILKDLSAHSYISRRLWKSVKSLRNIAPKLGLAPIKPGPVDRLKKDDEPRQKNVTDNSYNSDAPTSLDVAAMEMSGPSEVAAPQNGYNIPVLQPFPGASDSAAVVSENFSSELPNMHQMGDELTNIFEAFDNFGDGQQPNDLADWMTEAGINSLQNGLEISRLFEGFL